MTQWYGWARTKGGSWRIVTAACATLGETHTALRGAEARTDTPFVQTRICAAGRCPDDSAARKEDAKE